MTSNRNDLTKEPLNKILIEKLIDFMIDTAIEISVSSGRCDYAPLQLLTTDMSSFLLDRHFDFTTILNRKLRSAKILPTIDNKYYSIDDAPKLSSSGFERVLDPKVFPDLLKPVPKGPIVDFVKTLGLKFYSQEEFKNKINDDLNYYSLENKCELIYCFKHEYSYFSHVPYLLVDDMGESICDDSDVFPLGGDVAFIGLPNWVSVHFLNSEMENILRKKFD